jgi:hypothetical protein
MGDTILWKYCAWLALFSSPAIPLIFAWRRLVSDRSARGFIQPVPLSIATISLLWFDAAAANLSFLGPSDGSLHHAITGGNLLAMLVCAAISLGCSFFRKARAQRIATGLACLMLAVEWTFFGITYR